MWMLLLTIFWNTSVGINSGTVFTSKKACEAAAIQLVQAIQTDEHAFAGDKPIGVEYVCVNSYVGTP